MEESLLKRRVGQGGGESGSKDVCSESGSWCWTGGLTAERLTSEFRAFSGAQMGGEPGEQGSTLSRLL